MHVKSMRLLALLAGLLPAVHAGGFFIVQCGNLTSQRADPIVSPGQLSSHNHAITGGTAFALSMTNEQARNSKTTTCNKLLDHSLYWQPQLYHLGRDNKFQFISLLGINAYYEDRACDWAPGRKYCDGAPGARAPPAGLRMLTGDTKRRTYNSSSFADRAIQHVCLDLGNGKGQDSIGLLQHACREMRTETYFPSCWNGRDLDSSDHKSHMSFPTNEYNGGVCPESHPVAIVSVFTEFFYNCREVPDNDFNLWVYANGDAIGYALHGDYVQGWTDQGRLENAMKTCTGPLNADDPNCSLNVGPNGKPGVITNQVPETPAPAEEVGRTRRLDKLPGDNPVYRS